MILKKITTKITYRVPAWDHCNLQANMLGQPSKEKCRFCIKERGYYRCALYNEVLGTSEGTLINKAGCCKGATLGIKSIVEDVVEQEKLPNAEPKDIAKAAIKEYTKAYKQLLSDGYPEAIANRLAMEYVTGGK